MTLITESCFEDRQTKSKFLVQVVQLVALFLFNLVNCFVLELST